MALYSLLQNLRHPDGLVDSFLMSHADGCIDFLDGLDFIDALDILDGLDILDELDLLDILDFLDFFLSVEWEN